MSNIQYGKLDAVFNETRFQGAMDKLYETETPGLSAMKSVVTKQKIGPKGLRKTFKTGQIGSMSFLLPGGDFPVGIENRYEHLFIYLTENAVSLEIDRMTYQALQQGIDTEISFGQQVQDMVELHGQDSEIHFWGNGDAAIATLDAGSTHTTTRLYFETTPDGSSPGYHFGAENIRPNTKYDLINPASPSSPVATGIQFKEGFIVKDAAIPYADLTVALGGAPSGALRVVPTGSYGLGFKGMAFMSRYPRPTYWQGVYTVNQPNWNGVYVDAGGREFSLALRRRLQDKMTLRFGKEMTDSVFHWMHPAQETNWAAAGYGFIRLSQPPKELDMEIKGGRYRGSVFEIFPKCDPDTMYIGKRDAYVYAYLSEPQTIKEDGLTMRIKPGAGSNGTNASAFTMNYGAIEQFGVIKPKDVHCITNLGVSGAVMYGNFRLGT